MKDLVSIFLPSSFLADIWRIACSVFFIVAEDATIFPANHVVPNLTFTLVFSSNVK